MAGDRRLVPVVARSSEDPEENKVKSKFYGITKQHVNEKLPACEGQFRHQLYVEKDYWPEVISCCSEELLLWEDQPLTTYRERDEVR